MISNAFCNYCKIWQSKYSLRRQVGNRGVTMVRFPVKTYIFILIVWGFFASCSSQLIEASTKKWKHSWQSSKVKQIVHRDKYGGVLYDVTSTIRRYILCGLKVCRTQRICMFSEIALKIDHWLQTVTCISLNSAYIIADKHSTWNNKYVNNLILQSHCTIRQGKQNPRMKTTRWSIVCTLLSLKFNVNKLLPGVHVPTLIILNTYHFLFSFLSLSISFFFK